MSHNTAHYQLGRLERALEVETTFLIGCGYCDATVEDTAPGGALAITIARELFQRGWSFLEGDDEKPRCKACRDAGRDHFHDAT